MNYVYTILGLAIIAAATVLMVVDSIKSRHQLRKSQESYDALVERLDKLRIEAAIHGALAAPKEEWRALFPHLFKEKR